MAVGLPLLLGGCFAMQRDIEPVRSNVSVLEKQYMELQQEQTRTRRQIEDKQDAGAELKETVSEIKNRLKAAEKRLDALEAQVKDAKKPEAMPGPQTSAPEPVIVAPLEGAVKGPEAPKPSANVGSPEDLYRSASAALGSGDYKKAEAGFSSFLEKYPKDSLADGAKVGLGDVYYARKDYPNALKEYGQALNDHPQGGKAPDAGLKLGITLESMGRKLEAGDAYKRVMDNYPYSEAAKKARARLDGLK